MSSQSAYILNRSIHLAIKENLKMATKWTSYSDLNFFWRFISNHTLISTHPSLRHNKHTLVADCWVHWWQISNKNGYIADKTWRAWICIWNSFCNLFTYSCGQSDYVLSTTYTNQAFNCHISKLEKRKWFVLDKSRLMATECWGWHYL